LKNFERNQSNLTSVTPDDVAPFVNGFPGIPVNLADLSGYGLSTFSEWAKSTDGAGFVKAEFRVMNGRTSYEVLQFRSMLYECGSRLVRTVILERHNSGRVYRWDSGWNSIEPGRFLLPLKFEKCVVVSFQNIRRIRITGAPSIPISAQVVMEPVIFDADVELEGHGALVPIYDRPGYVELPAPPPAPPPNAPIALLTPAELRTLFKKVGPISGPIDALIRVGGTLDTQLANIVSDYAPDNGGGDGFATAITGMSSCARELWANMTEYNAVRVTDTAATFQLVRRSASLNTPYSPNAATSSIAVRVTAGVKLLSFHHIASQSMTNGGCALESVVVGMSWPVRKMSYAAGT